jgi:hypothetical protein
MTVTYEAIASQTLTSSQATITFSSIPSTYTDLILVAVGKPTSGASLYMRFNSNTGSNYSYTQIEGYSAGAFSNRLANATAAVYGVWRTTTTQYSIVQIQNYSNTTRNKTSLCRSFDNDGTQVVRAFAGLWRNTSAINRIDLFADSSYDTDCTFSLYGIKAE